ncbi:MAG: TonB-dependent receptor [Caulobacterales bacterium]
MSCVRFLPAIWALAWPAVVVAAPADDVGPVEVIAASPLPGSLVDRDKVPVDIDVLRSGALAHNGAPGLLTGLDQRIGGVSLDEAQDNPFQPNLIYRGFEASPLGGDAQGLAVYVDGVRFNQPFGDTVNWDLIPDAAVEALTVEGSNPVFGLNALGGSISVKLKDGFADPGGTAEASGGSFGRVEGSVQYGMSAGSTSFFLAATGLHEAGWRAHSPSTLGQVYADVGWRDDRGEAHLSLIGADNDLTGNGVAPVQLLAADRSAVFTFPDDTRNRYVLASLRGRRDVGGGVLVQGEVYLSALGQRTANADASEVRPCAGDIAVLCSGDGPALTDPAGAPIPSDLAGAAGFGQLNQTRTDTFGYGASAEVSADGRLFGHANRLLAGASLDGGRTDFSAASLVGALTLQRGFAGPGVEIDTPGALITPVSVAATNKYWGLYASDVLDLTDALSVTASGRLNVAQIRLRDRLGGAVSGDHRFTHFNPALGATYRLGPDISAYAGYSQSNRAPTPAELSCADPGAPCSLTNFFVADPTLKQVVATTFEGGLRGRWTPRASVTFSWKLAAFRTDSADDIQLVASPVLGRAFFRNIGATRRQGVDASLEVQGPRLSAYLTYDYAEATYRTAVTLFSPNNPRADANGQIQVAPGDRLPGVPASRLKFGLDWQATSAWSVSLDGTASDGQYLFGDEANLTPKTRAYVVVGLSSSYRLTPRLELFAQVQNLFDERYETYGAFSPTAEVPLVEAPGASDPRSLSPAPPRAIYGGFRWKL